MRKLGLKDAFSVARILKAANIRNELVAFGVEVRERQQAAKESGKTADLNIEKIGFEFFVTLITSVSDEKVEKKIYQLYADLKTSPDRKVDCEEVAEYDFATIKNDIKELIKQNDLGNFFKSLSALM